jgi:hypothetical protein
MPKLITIPQWGQDLFEVVYDFLKLCIISQVFFVFDKTTSVKEY